MNKLEKLKMLQDRANIKIHGMNNYPKNSTCLIFTNHTCLMDIFYIPMILNEEIVSAISARLMFKNDVKRKAIINELLNPIPIEAHGISFYKEICLLNASNILSNGISVNIFPEGIYIPDKNTIYRGRTGGARILFNALINNPNIKLVPISIKYNNIINNIDSYNFDNNDIDIYILEPIEYKELFEIYMNTDNFNIRNECLHQLTDQAMLNIAKSLNQKYSNNYFMLDKKDMILPDGKLISDIDCINLSVQKQYKKTLENNSKILCRRLSR